MTGQLFLTTAAAVAPLLRAPELTARWNEPSVLVDFATSGLAGHTARAVFNVERYLDAAVPEGAVLLDATEYFLAASNDEVSDPGSVANRSVRERGEEEAADGPGALADAYDAALARLA